MRVAKFYQRLARVVAAEIDRLGDIGIGLAPGFGLLVDLHRNEAEAVLREQCAELVDVRGAGFQRQVAPRGPCFFCDGDGLLDIGQRGGVRARGDARFVVGRDVKKGGSGCACVAVDDDRDLPRHLPVGLGHSMRESGGCFRHGEVGEGTILERRVEIALPG